MASNFLYQESSASCHYQQHIKMSFKIRGTNSTLPTGVSAELTAIDRPVHTADFLLLAPYKLPKNNYPM
jgi:hypothetical protein